MAIYRHNLFSILKPRYFSKNVVTRTSYDADGKTSVTVLNNQSETVMIDSYSKYGFRLNNGVFVIGPVVIFPGTIFSWNVGGDHDISAKSLSLFTIIEPKLDLLVIGFAADVIHQRKFMDTELLAIRSRRHMNIEVLPVVKALSTYNYLCNEGRWVAGAFIPPLNIAPWESEIAIKRERKQRLYEMDD